MKNTKDNQTADGSPFAARTVGRLRSWWENTLKPLLIIGAIVLAVLSLIIGIPYLQFKAYRERFPDAPAWTFFFQGGRK